MSENQPVSPQLSFQVQRRGIEFKVQIRISEQNRSGSKFQILAILSHLCPYNSTSFVLLSLLNNKFSPLSFLCSHLFRFYRSCELLPKSQACNGDIIQCNVEISRSLCQYLPDFPTNSLQITSGLPVNSVTPMILKLNQVHVYK